MLTASPERIRWRTWLGLALLLLLAWLCYLPGLHGGFLFDDFVNLDALGRRGPVDNWPAFWRYITSGSADPIGRPLSMLTFLIDGRDWPTSSYPFLRTNILLHLINGALLFGLLRRLELALFPAAAERENATALLASALWLLHPLFVSTTLYVVQREAMLPATFTLAGLWLFAHGRDAYRQSEGQRGTFVMFLGIVLGTGLAMLSKANGILLPLLAAVLAFTVVRIPAESLSEPARRKLSRLDFALLGVPALLVLALLVRPLGQLHTDLGVRSWTVAQRLLTEPRVLVQYLGLLVAPRAISTGLFNDEYPAATSLLQPWTTIPAILILVALITIGFRSRLRYPRLSAGLLFFFAGHLLESTTMPLELYFEHRNYLPAMLLFWPLAHAVVQWRAGARLRIGVAVVLIGICALTTAQRTWLWGQQDRLAAIWAAANPASSRARANAALNLMQSDRPDEAAALLLPLWQARPGEVQLAFNYVNARCSGPGLSTQESKAVGQAIQLAKGGNLLMNQWLSRALGLAADGGCAGMTLDAVEQWIDAAWRNPALGSVSTRDEDFQPLMGELAIYRNQADAALPHFRRALRASPTPDFAARLVTFLAAHDQFVAALTLLDEYQSGKYGTRPAAQGMPRLHEWVMQSQGFWPHEFAVLRRKLQDEIATRQGGDGVR
jgi:hypothetical protein